MRPIKSATPALRAGASVNNQQSAIIDGLLGLVFCLVYLSTCPPSALSADNGEFQLVAWKLGIAHPPGYVLYTIVGWLFSRLFASPAFALNVLSAILASFTLIVVSRTVRLLTRSTIAGVLAAGLLGTSTTFWAQATTANIRMPTALFTALCVSLLVSWSRSHIVERSISQSDRSIALSLHRSVTSPSRHLVTFSLIFSLGLGHHLSLAFPGVFFLIYVLLNDRALIKQPRRWITPVIAFALGLIVLLYLPLRGATGGTLADGETTTYLAQPDKFLDHVLARGFEGDFFYFINTRSDLLADRAALLPTLFTFQFNPFVIVLIVIGAARLIRNDWKLAVMLLGGIIVHTFVAITYHAPQTVEYLLPAYVLLAIVIGYGLQAFRSQKSEARLLTSGFWLLAPILIVAQFTTRFPSFQWLQHNDDTRAYAESLLNDMPANAIILSNWHWANPMWYLQQVEGVRPDVEVRYIYPRGETLAQSWLNSIEAGLKANRPVIVNMFFRGEFEGSPYTFEPLSREAWQVRESPRTDLPAGFQSLTLRLEDKIELIGYSLLDQESAPGEPLTISFAWRVTQPLDRDYSFFVHLVEPDGRVIGQSDHTLPTTRYRVGDVIVERFFIAPLVDTPAGDYSFTTGVYFFEGGKLIELESAPTSRPQYIRIKVGSNNSLRPNLPASAISLSGGIRFVNSSASSNGDVRPGDRLTLDLNFTAARPILRDYVVSVQMTGQGWRVTDDSVPALGAIPTLKWLAGSMITDRHIVTIPDNAAPGPATISVIVYDNFTQEPLALLDAELIKQGPSIPLGTWNVVTR